MEENNDNLTSFKGSYCKLAEMCSKAKDYLEIKNIVVPNDTDLEGIDFENEIRWVEF